MLLADTVDLGGIVSERVSEVASDLAGVSGEYQDGRRVADTRHRPRRLPSYLPNIFAQEDGQLVTPSPNSRTKADLNARSRVSGARLLDTRQSPPGPPPTDIMLSKKGGR